MTEAEWLSLIRPRRMLRVVSNLVTERRLRLLSLACERWAYPFADGETAAVWLASERVADGIETTDDIAMLDSLPVWRQRSWNLRPGYAITLDVVSRELPIARHNETQRVAQCEFIRCVFGNPFHPVTFSPSWPTPTVTALATGIYADRAFDRLPILADALQEAGCEDEQVLAHCRGDGPHARGCWVVDGVLGKA